MDKKAYIQANKDWLAKKSKEEGVLPLPKGIFYKVISSGDSTGKSPSLRSIVTVHYTGCTIDGKQFDTSRGGVPLAIRLSDLIEGWIIALQQMHPCRTRIWQTFPAWHPCRFHTDIRCRTDRGDVKQDLKNQ